MNKSIAIKQPQGLPDGIYFNLENDKYHDDPALSHSGMTHLLVSWQDFWMKSCFNPARKQNKVTDAMEFGQQSGMLLTQPDVFYKNFNTSGRAPTAKARFLSSVQWQKLRESVDAVLNVKIGKDHFSHGYAEVAVIWTDPTSGIRLRAKFDYLRTFGIIDFKRIADVDNWAIGRAVRAQGLDIQAFLYLEGLKAARGMLKAMDEYTLMKFAKDNQVNEKWLIALRDDTDLLFRFLFQRSTPPYIWEFRELEDDVMVEGGHAVLEAIRRYQEGLRLFGTDKPPMGRNKVKTISSYHVGRRNYEFEQD